MAFFPSKEEEIADFRFGEKIPRVSPSFPVLLEDNMSSFQRWSEGWGMIKMYMQCAIRFWISRHNFIRRHDTDPMSAPDKCTLQVQASSAPNASWTPRSRGWDIEWQMQRWKVRIRVIISSQKAPRQTWGLPLPVGRAVCETKSNKGAPETDNSSCAV